MAVRVLSPEAWDDQEFYPLHEEDDVPEIPPHEANVRHLRDVLDVRFPDWFITGNVCIYWERGNTKAYRAPDLLVVKEPLTEEVHRVYQTWKQPPIALVAEIGSRSTFRRDEGPKLAIYQDRVRAAEYLYADPPKGNRWLWRLGPNGYEEVAPAANGRLRSAELGLEFGLEEGVLRVYTLDGEMLLTHGETEAARQQEAVGRREAERLQEEAEDQRGAEARLRQEAEEQRGAEARLRQEAEEQRAEEARRREHAEARAADLERQLAALRARLEDP